MRRLAGDGCPGASVGSVVIAVDGLTKTFRVQRREPGIGASIRSLVRRTYVSADAVANVSFTVAAGEIVGFLGPNGAGKTTTLKCLSLLYPDGGSVNVLGFEPYKRKAEFLKQITLVLGQRTSLLWDFPASDAFAVNKAIYRIPAHPARVPRQRRQETDPHRVARDRVHLIDDLEHPATK